MVTQGSSLCFLAGVPVRLRLAVLTFYVRNPTYAFTNQGGMYAHIDAARGVYPERSTAVGTKTCIHGMLVHLHVNSEHSSYSSTSTAALASGSSVAASSGIWQGNWKP